jgi:hypothetical protein
MIGLLYQEYYYLMEIGGNNITYSPLKKIMHNDEDN